MRGTSPHAARGAIFLPQDKKLLPFESYENLTPLAEHKLSGDASHVAADAVNDLVWVLGAEGKDSLVRLPQLTQDG